MSRSTVNAAIAAMLVAAPPAYTQTAVPYNAAADIAAHRPAASTNPPLSGQVEDHLLPGQVRFTQMNGAEVFDRNDKNIANITDVVLDPNGRIAAVVVDVGAFLGIGGKNVALGMSDLKITTAANGKPHFVVDMTKDQLKSAQAFSLSPENAAVGSSRSPARSTHSSR